MPSFLRLSGPFQILAKISPSVHSSCACVGDSLPPWKHCHFHSLQASPFGNGCGRPSEYKLHLTYCGMTDTCLCHLQINATLESSNWINMSTDHLCLVLSWSPVCLDDLMSEVYPSTRCWDHLNQYNQSDTLAQVLCIGSQSVKNCLFSMLKSNGAALIEHCHRFFEVEAELLEVSVRI